MRILFIHSTLVPPLLDPRADRFQMLSQTIEGDILHPVWFDTPEQVEAEFGAGSYPSYTRGRFRYHWFLGGSKGQRSRLAQFWFYFSQGRKLYRQHRFDCIVAYSHMTTGLLAALVKLFTGAKLVIEVVTTPHLVYVTEKPRPTVRDRVMKLYSDVCLHLSLWAADRAHLLYPAQLVAYPLLRNRKASVFPDFVPVSLVPAQQKSDEHFVLMVGAPWYLKGTDRLIEAFKRLAPDFPDIKLKILGWYLIPDREQLEALAGGLKQIELVRAMPNPPTLEMISRSLVMVLPSRCEGVPRVLMEGMAAGVPVIGSDAGGIPYIVHDDENGFVVPGGDPKELERRLRELLSDEGLRVRLGANGRGFALREWGDRAYVEHFTRMIQSAVKRDA